MHKCVKSLLIILFALTQVMSGVRGLLAHDVGLSHLHDEVPGLQLARFQYDRDQQLQADGQFLYLMVFGEAAGAQTPFGDSPLAYDNDAIDIFLDGNNSKGTSYDGVDDYHVIITLLSTQAASSANSTAMANTRFELGDRSSPIDISAFEFDTWRFSIRMGTAGLEPEPL